jgi:hypothetical protein
VAAASLVGEEIVLSGDGDDISAELQDELLAAGIEVSEADADAVARMQAVLANYDHSESTLYQPKLSS